MKKIVSALISFVLLLSLASCGEAPYKESAENTLPEPESSQTEITVDAIASAVVSEELSDVSSEAETLLGDKISIVVLGDSIARGYGLENVETERFSSVLGEKLKARYNEVSVSNFGVDGQEGAELVSFLKADPPKELKDCDVVIVSVGGNNVLGSLTEFSGALEPFRDVPPKVFADYFFYLFPPEGSKKSDYRYAADTINSLFKAVNGIFYSDAYKNKMKQCADGFKKEIPEIIAQIRKVNPDARILFQTVYNPYKNLDISLIGIEEKLSLGDYGKESVSLVNQAVTELAEANGYEVVPIFERFEESARPLVNAGFSLMAMKFSLDPHPNSYGHAYIAEIYYKLLTEDNNE